MNKLFTRLGESFVCSKHPVVDSRRQLFRLAIRMKFTIFPQDLGIEFLPDFGDLLADEKIKLNGFFNFFNRMNGGRMIFSP